MSNLKAAQLQDVLHRMGDTATSGLSGTSDRIRDWYANLDPIARSAILRGLAGAAVGGGITGGLAMMTPKDPEEKRWKSVLSPTLLGAVLGGVGAAGLPVAEQMFAGQLGFSGEKRKPFMTSATDSLLGVPIHHPAATAGTVLGGLAYGANTAPSFHEAAGGLRNLLGHVRHGRFGAIGDAYHAGALKHMDDLKEVPSLVNKFGPNQIASLARKGYHGGTAALIAAPIAGLILDKYIKGDY